MKLFDHSFRYLTDKRYRFDVNTSLGLYNCVSDERFLRKAYELRTGQPLNIRNPQTFNEKIQWLKLYDHKPEYTMMVDKILVKDYVARVIGPEHIIPTLGTWDDPDEIDFSALPDQFVLKCNHNCGLGMCICKNKEELNISKVKKELKKGLKQNYYLLGREWPYKNVEHGIIAEKYMTDGSGTELKDYKFYCFNGEPKFLYIGYANMRDGTKHDLLSFFDLNLDPTPFYRTDHEPLPFAVERPEKLDKMIEIARKLSNGIPFLRVDLYYIQEQIYFSELTFYPGSGYGLFSPPEWERKIGDMLILPQVRKRA